MDTRFAKSLGTSPWPTTVVNDPSTIVIFLELEHDVHDMNRCEQHVIWSVAPKSRMGIWKGSI